MTSSTSATWTCWAHPRRCGEHPPPGHGVHSGSGSSPQVRGTYRIPVLAASGWGLIPAGAGNMPPTPSKAGDARAHPRRCGEHPVCTMQVNDWTGSSPQVRGTYRREDRGPRADGLIPAGAGNMLASAVRPGGIRAHPRRCGEHHRPECRGASPAGSSPQVRGTCRRRQRSCGSSGLIPAGAGNITRWSEAARCSRAHPRRCGEHADNVDDVPELSGSSPQVRGTSTRSARIGRGTGLIPAGAGNMRSPPTWRRPSGAHPRRCGEHGASEDDLAPVPGSSPQVRGTWRARRRLFDRHGLIPAGAGNMSFWSFWSGLSGAHPRRCGEHVNVPSPCTVGTGSSPQVRGTSDQRPRLGGRLGLIPAGAGNMAASGTRTARSGAHPRRCGEHTL